eukprot:jgi/Chlat1/8590/Chrsp86S07990
MVRAAPGGGKIAGLGGLLSSRGEGGDDYVLLDGVSRPGEAQTLQTQLEGAHAAGAALGSINPHQAYSVASSYGAHASPPSSYTHSPLPVTNGDEAGQTSDHEPTLDVYTRRRGRQH